MNVLSMDDAGLTRRILPEISPCSTRAKLGSLDVGSFRLLVERFPDRYPALLESAAPHPRIGRRSMLFAFPGCPVLATPGRKFFDDLDAAHRTARGFGHLVYLGYEMLAQIETLEVPPAPPALPTAIALPITAVISLDHQTGSVSILCGSADPDAIAAAVEEDLRACAVPTPPAAYASAREVDEDEPQMFVRAVKRAKEHIVAGDIFQANISREWRARLDPGAGPIDIYRALCRHNPAPFAGVFRWGEAAILSSSPERLLCSDGHVLQSRPIAGTRPRTGTDAVMVAELLANEKERAEHVMLVDLIRNDLGRVARYGTVEVDELMEVESYAHVHHIVSNVRCELADGVTPGAILAAAFPGGTITGCPKVRCMEIIGELEGVGRGAYTGSLGYVEAGGSMDFNILIRTMVWAPGIVRFRAGAGIVADSDPLAELEETRAKARGLLRALGAEL